MYASCQFIDDFQFEIIAFAALSICAHETLNFLDTHLTEEKKKHSFSIVNISLFFFSVTFVLCAFVMTYRKAGANTRTDLIHWKFFNLNFERYHVECSCTSA